MIETNIHLYISIIIFKRIIPQPKMFQKYITTKTFLPFKGQRCKSLPQNNHFKQNYLELAKFSKCLSLGVF